MNGSEPDTAPVSRPHRCVRSDPRYTLPHMTGDARTDRALLTLASLLAEIADVVQSTTADVASTVDPAEGEARHDD